MQSLDKVKIAVIGQGYVGLPLAVEFGKQFDVVGFDINDHRVGQLRAGTDHTRETSSEGLASATHLAYTSDLQVLGACNVFIVTVPIPVDEHKRLDLTPLVKASQSIGKVAASRPGVGSTSASAARLNRASPSFACRAGAAAAVTHTTRPWRWPSNCFRVRKSAGEKAGDSRSLNWSSTTPRSGSESKSSINSKRSPTVRHTPDLTIARKVVAIDSQRGDLDVQ